MRISGRPSTFNDTEWEMVPLEFEALTEYWPD